MVPETETMLEEFNRQGFVVARGLLDYDEDLRPVIDEYDALLDQLIDQWHSDGLLTSTFKGLPFEERLRRSVEECAPAYGQHFDFTLPQSNITTDTPMHHGPAVFDILRNPKLLDVAEAFVGPEILLSPVHHTRCKLPEDWVPEGSRSGVTMRIAWHQDQGVLDPEGDETNMLTVWFPLTRATVENGCLAVVPGSHRHELAFHCRSRDALTMNQVCIPETMIAENQVPLPMEPGDVLFMHRLTQHSGLPNRSNEIRWSFDLRYQPIDQPTGRPWFPGFIARSRANPQSVETDWRTWAQDWRDARERLAEGDDVAFNRWSSDDPRCA